MMMMGGGLAAFGDYGGEQFGYDSDPNALNMNLYEPIAADQRQ